MATPPMPPCPACGTTTATHAACPLFGDGTAFDHHPDLIRFVGAPAREGVDVIMASYVAPDEVLPGETVPQAYARLKRGVVVRGIAAAAGITTYTCGWCGFVTPHPDDVANAYCPRCHEFERDRRERERLAGDTDGGRR